MPAPATTLPLFPLRTVLFPGGRLQLRIFERRYLDLVRDCSRSGTVFGVCLIIDGEEVGSPAMPAPVGTSARIVDFDQLPGGLLGITVEGEQRFHAEGVRVRDNGLVTATVQWLPEAPVQPVAPEHSLLVRLLETLFEHEGGPSDADQHMDDSDWVAYRLAERLPLDNGERQALLQAGDAHDRLERILAWLSRASEAGG